MSGFDDPPWSSEITKLLVSLAKRTNPDAGNYWRYKIEIDASVCLICNQVIDRKMSIYYHGYQHIKEMGLLPLI